MIKFSKFSVLPIFIILFSCDNNVTGNGDDCTADPVGEWSGLTRTIEYASDCGLYCEDINYTLHYQHTGCSAWTDPALCEMIPFEGYSSLDCYSQLAPSGGAWVATPNNACNTYSNEEDCNDDLCKWQGTNLGCVDFCNDDEKLNIQFYCEWDLVENLCGAPATPTANDLFLNYISCNQSNEIVEGSSCMWDGSITPPFNGNCLWENDLSVVSNIESESFTFDEDGNFIFENDNEEIERIGDYSCSDENVEICEDGECEIWPFDQNENQTVTIFRKNYVDEFTDYKEECSATESILIQKKNN